MSEENIEILREMLSRFEAGDRTALKAFFDEEVVWDTAAATPGAGVYRGHDGIEQFFADWLEAWEDPTVEYLELIDAGDSAVSVFRWSGRGRTSGVPAQGDFFGVYTLHDGKVIAYRQFESRAEALEAAGLSE
jgi:ketosteroid isomerase-like protein